MAAGAVVLNTKVLVLNRHYLPVHVTSVRRAFSLLYQGLAEAVDEQYRTFDFASWSALAASVHDDTVGMVGRLIRVPRVILLLTYDRIPKRQVRFNRFNVYARDRNACQYCGHRFPRTELNLDHVIPRHYGGKTTWENIVCSCIKCNSRKANRLPHEAHMRLIRKPVRPKWRPVISLVLHNHGHEKWKDFLDVAYWNVELEE